MVIKKDLRDRLLEVGVAALEGGNKVIDIVGNSSIARLGIFLTIEVELL